jgi:hypothetical protein
LGGEIRGEAKRDPRDPGLVKVRFIPVIRVCTNVTFSQKPSDHPSSPLQSFPLPGIISMICLHVFLPTWRLSFERIGTMTILFSIVSLTLRLPTAEAPYVLADLVGGKEEGWTDG